MPRASYQNDILYMRQLKQHAPWWMKICAKILLSNLPIDYSWRKKIGLFEHGQMNQPAYAFRVFNDHFKEVNVQPGFVALEMGPGDSVASALVARAMGASQTYLVDVGEYATKDITFYQALHEYVAERKNRFDIDFSSFESMLASCNATYMTHGLASLRSIESDSVDFVWSQAVLEHLDRKEFLDTFIEIRRILKSKGVSSHVVDLRDHLDGGLNNLRFSEERWESELFKRSGFYTNRLRFSEILEAFRAAAFEPQVMWSTKWEQMPTAKSDMDEQFERFREEDLLVSGFKVRLIPV